MDAWGLEWLIMFLWLGLTIIGFWRNNIIIKGGSSVIGLFFALTMFGDSVALGFILLFINIGMLYVALFK